LLTKGKENENYVEIPIMTREFLHLRKPNKGGKRKSHEHGEPEREGPTCTICNHQVGEVAF